MTKFSSLSLAVPKVTIGEICKKLDDMTKKVQNVKDQFNRDTESLKRC